ncbi:hypothetical protein [Corynebacterium sp.]|uniref:hypothetical protein n=1 Tax=Corynebacterium sp. TaxID=1720 RepID=UPI0028AAFEAB|nr:hypothetical protein [Corynebacterium sp.]
MPYTVHTLDGHAHTYPDPATLHVEDDRSLRVYDDMEIAPGPMPIRMHSDPIAVYPAGQWAHYHVEPAPYETDVQSSEDKVEARQKVEGRLAVSVEEKDKWQASFQRHLERRT